MHSVSQLELALFGVCVAVFAFVALPKLLAYIRKDILSQKKAQQEVEKEIDKLEHDLAKLQKVQFTFTPPVDDLDLEYNQTLEKIKIEAKDDLELKAHCLQYKAKRMYINKVKAEIMQKLSQEKFIELCLKECEDKMSQL